MYKSGNQQYLIYNFLIHKDAKEISDNHNEETI